MLIGRDSRNRRHIDHCARTEPPDNPVFPGHRTPPAAIANSVVSTMSIMS
jgi:hypothetical protein